MDEKFVKYKDYVEYPKETMISRSIAFYDRMRRRRTVRDFSERDFPISIIENCIKSAGTAPNGANKQPWHFVIIKNKEIKKQIRIEAEKEEKEFYQHRAPKEWLDALEHLGTDENKPFLEKAPYLIAIFERKFDVKDDGSTSKNYYTKESVGIATGFLIAALHHAGLSTLTHTPSPMNFLNKILKRPSNEKPFLLLVVGYPEEDALVPNIKKKKLEEITTVL